MGQKRTREELVRLLSEHRQALASSCAGYDSGNEWEAARLATAIFTLLHDGGRIESLLTQLGLRAGLRFLSSNRVDDREGMISSSPPLVGWKLIAGQTPKFVPVFALGASSSKHKRLQFQAWWGTESVFKSSLGALSRRRIVFGLRHQDGGSHVGELTDPTYVHLKGGAGWFASTGGPGAPMDNGVTATMRQIAWEVTETLKDLGEVS